MKILDFDEEEFEEALEIGRDNTKEEGETMEELIDTSFNSILFLGKNIKESSELFDVAVFNIRLCYTYYKKIEDYGKMAEIASLVKELEVIKHTIIDRYIIDEIVINLN